MLRFIAFVGVFLLGLTVCTVLPTPFHMTLFQIMSVPMTLSVLLSLTGAILVAMWV